MGLGGGGAIVIQAGVIVIQAGVFYNIWEQ